MIALFCRAPPTFGRPKNQVAAAQAASYWLILCTQPVVPPPPSQPAAGCPMARRTSGASRRQEVFALARAPPNLISIIIMIAISRRQPPPPPPGSLEAWKSLLPRPHHSCRALACFTRSPLSPKDKTHLLARTLLNRLGARSRCRPATHKPLHPPPRLPNGRRLRPADPPTREANGGSKSKLMEQ